MIPVNIGSSRSYILKVFTLYNSYVVVIAPFIGVANLFGNGKLPAKEHLQNAVYCYKGWAWNANRVVYETPEDDPYKKDILMQSYEEHNAAVLEYFRHRPDDLLVINLAHKDAYTRLCKFLNKKPLYNQMPWENKTESTNKKFFV